MNIDSKSALSGVAIAFTALACGPQTEFADSEDRVCVE